MLITLTPSNSHHLVTDWFCHVPTSVYQHQCTFIGEPTSLYLHWCTFIGVPLLVYLHRCTYIGVPSLVYLHRCTYISIPSTVYLHRCMTVPQCENLKTNFPSEKFHNFLVRRKIYPKKLFVALISVIFSHNYYYEATMNIKIIVS